MIATLAPEELHLEETVSTCRFAQRVALVANTMHINEEVDDKLIVMRLRAQVRELKEQIQILRGEGYERPVSALDHDEVARCEELVRAYVGSANPEEVLAPGELAKVQLCFRLLRNQLRSAVGGGMSREDRNFGDQNFELVVGGTASSGGDNDPLPGAIGGGGGRGARPVALTAAAARPRDFNLGIDAQQGWSWPRWW